MATKKEIFASAIEICTELNLGEAAVAKFTDLLEPKKGGAQFNIEDVTMLDADGAITHILDSMLGCWVPVFDDEGGENFYAKPDTELAWSRFSKVAEKGRKDREKAYKATEKAVFADLMDGAIEPEDAKELMETAETTRRTVIIPEDIGAITLEA